jgi:hypothetical protein
LVRFEVADILKVPGLGRFDAVIAIRFLTCLSDRASWLSAAHACRSLCNPGGVVYFHDFALDPENPAYQDRYRKGALLGHRWGTFEVPAPDGSVAFLAHHHTDGEIAELARLVDQAEVTFHRGTSMRGNPCRMFELVGFVPRQQS